MNIKVTGFLFILLVFLLSPFSNGQDDDQLLNKFNENLRINFLAPLQAQGITVNNELRAKCVGYLLNRQAQYMGNYEQDRIKVRELQKKVRDFMESVSAEQNLWAIVETGIAGKYKREIDSLLGGSVYVSPIMTSLDDLYDKRREMDFNQSRYLNHPDRNKIMAAAQDFLETIREKRYQDITFLIGGHLAREWPKFITTMNENPDYRKQMEKFSENLDWKLFSSGMSSTDPPFVRLVFGLMDVDEWEDYEILLILDAGTWRIVRFDKE